MLLIFNAATNPNPPTVAMVTYSRVGRARRPARPDRYLAERWRDHKIGIVHDGRAANHRNSEPVQLRRSPVMSTTSTAPSALFAKLKRRPA